MGNLSNLNSAEFKMVSAVRYYNQLRGHFIKVRDRTSDTAWTSYQSSHSGVTRSEWLDIVFANIANETGMSETFLRSFFSDAPNYTTMDVTVIQTLAANTFGLVISNITDYYGRYNAIINHAADSNYQVSGGAPDFAKIAAASDVHSSVAATTALYYLNSNNYGYANVEHLADFYTLSFAENNAVNSVRAIRSELNTIRYIRDDEVNGMTNTMWETFHANYPDTPKDEWVTRRCNAIGTALGISPNYIKILYDNGSFSVDKVKQRVADTYRITVERLENFMARKSSVDNLANSSDPNHQWHNEDGTPNFSTIAAYIRTNYPDYASSVALTKALYDIKSDNFSTVTTQYTTNVNDIGEIIQYSEQDINNMVDAAVADIGQRGADTVLAEAVRDLYRKNDPDNAPQVSTIINDFNTEVANIETDILNATKTRLVAGATFATIASELNRREKYLIGMVFRDDIVGTNGIFTRRDSVCVDYVTVNIPKGNNDIPLMDDVPVYVGSTGTTVKTRFADRTVVQYNRLVRDGRYNVIYETSSGNTDNGWIPVAYSTLSDNVTAAYNRRINRDYVETGKMRASELDNAVSTCKSIHEGLFLKNRINYFKTHNKTDGTPYQSWEIAVDQGILKIPEKNSGESDSAYNARVNEMKTNAGNYIDLFHKYTF